MSLKLSGSITSSIVEVTVKLDRWVLMLTAKKKRLLIPENHSYSNSYFKQPSFSVFLSSSKLAQKCVDTPQTYDSSPVKISRIYEEDSIKLLVAPTCSSYTELTEAPHHGTLKGVMDTLLRLTGTATLLVILQIFSPSESHATNPLNIAANISSNRIYVSEESNSLAERSLKLPNLKGYEPPDNSGPQDTRGSGTR